MTTRRSSAVEVHVQLHASGPCSGGGAEKETTINALPAPRQPGCQNAVRCRAWGQGPRPARADGSPFPGRPAGAVHAARRSGSLSGSFGPGGEGPACRRCTWPGSRGRRIRRAGPGILPGPPVARPQMPEPALHDEEGMLHLRSGGMPFLDSMPFSAESVQSRPFMVEGFLATVQRIEERWGSDGDLRGASPRPCSRSPHSRTRRPPSRGHAPWTHVETRLRRSCPRYARGRCRHRRRYAPCIRNASSCPSWTFGRLGMRRAWPLFFVELRAPR